MSIYKKLHKIQAHILGLGKDKEGNSYRYVTGDKLLGHIKPIMNELGLILKQEIISIDNERQNYHTSLSYNQETKTWNGKPKGEILSKVMMRFTWVDVETGEKDENLFGANGQNDWDKGVGSALTYGERYFLLKFFHIATDEDDIDNPNRKKEEEEEIVLKISKAQTRKDLADLFNEVGKHKGYNALLLKREKELIDLGLIQPKKPK